MRIEKLLRAVAVSIGLLVGGQSAGAASGSQIYLFSQPFCPGCEAAKAYLRAHEIDYREFDITSSDAALSAFKRLGGRGTPFFIIGGQRMHGFTVGRFEQRLKDAGIIR
ncbi:glutaredoxin [Marinobacter santoriniensis NKSG1]|uniref:Glutaredoxin n=1 Tax=Marinobacter santoriniensis NKSG1 TaxID=1288826 RepID=M7CMJ9_9GAMM|nr:glutaredoxin family protein [Marinobacter santoriniensis]EMP54389.1 glutaredoxin [Marinobacter santoriniensis NKSG1]